jgi:alanyl-tRNA synthetase
MEDVIAVMGKDYPELIGRQPFIMETIRREEEIFARTLEDGIVRLESLFSEQASGITGDAAFRLYDTYGLPIELTVELAQDRGITVDMAGFSRAMDAQRARSKAASKTTSMERGVELGATEFVGYEGLESDATVSRIGIPDEVEKLSAGEENTVIFEPTPFYAEAGGQIGDTGSLEWEGGKATVLDTVYVPGTKARAHKLKVEKGTLVLGQAIHAKVDADRRGRIIRHHSATHLLHKALRETLGETAVQKGSYVGPDHTTFDFAFGRALADDEVAEVENLINHAIRENLAKKTTIMSLEQAKKTGAMALFGEKYGEAVRVVEFGDWSKELCGGTHVEHTGDIGAAIIVSETSVGQGVRRIEMVVGEAAVRYWNRMRSGLEETSQVLKVPPQQIAERVVALQEQLRKLTKQLEGAKEGSGNLLEGAEVEQVGDLQFASLLLNGRPDAAELVPTAVDRLFAERIGGDGVACVFGADVVAIKVGKKWVEAGISAGDLVSTACQVAGGKGGGRPDFARGGISDPAKVQQALLSVKSKLSERK